MNYYQNESQKGTFTFRPWIEKTGTYEVSIWYPSKDTYASRVPVIIEHKGGADEESVNMKDSGGKWFSLGKCNLERGYREVITINAENSDGTVVADAIKLKLVGK